MRILVLGSSGMVGHTVAIYLKELGYYVDGVSRKKKDYVNTIICDAIDSNSLKTIVAEGEYDYVINCIGVLNEFANNDKSTAIYLNSYLPHFLANITCDMKTSIIHMSTDCVFSGEKGGYRVSDYPDGRTFYDRSKALGELIDDKNITLRCSVVGPDVNPQGIGLYNWFMMQRGEIKGYANFIWTGLTSIQLARTIDALMCNKKRGIFHAVPSKSISKYELLNLFNKYSNTNKSIVPVEEPKVNKSLMPSEFGFDFVIPDYSAMVYEMTEWINNHSYLYPHYFNT